MSKPSVEVEDAVTSIDRAYGVVSKTKRDCSPLSFYMPTNLHEAYIESGWCAEKRTSILTKIAENFEDDPRAALAAIDQLEKYNWAAVKATGQISEIAISQKIERDGVITEQDVKTMRLGGIQPPVEMEAVDEPRLEQEEEEQEEDANSDVEGNTGLFQ